MHSPLITRAAARLAVAALALATPAVLAAPAVAVSADVVISQVYGAGGNSGAVYNADFVELFNRGSAPVSLAGKSIQYASATGTGAFGQTVTLSGVLAPGQRHLVGMTAGANGAVLPPTDATGAISMAAGAGKVVLANTTADLGCNGGSSPCSAAQLAQMVDVVGYGSANFFEGSAAPTLSATTAAVRASDGCTDTDVNSTDFAAAPPAPRNSAAALTPCGGAPVDLPPTTTCPASLFAPYQEGATTQVSAVDDKDAIGSIAITSAAIDGISLENLDLDAGTADLTVASTTAPGAYTVTIALATNAQTPQTSTCTIAVTVEGAPVITPIAEIQGSGSATTLTQRVTTLGVVTAAYPTGGFRGVYIQTPGTGGSPKSPGDSSDGIFVFSDWAAGNTEVGDCVRVEGMPAEFNGLTQLSGSPRVTVLEEDCLRVTPTDLTALPVTDAAKEVYEGMLVHPKGTYTITNNFALNTFGQLGLAIGDQPLYQATDVVAPGAEAVAYELENQAKYITLDDGASVNLMTNAAARNTFALPYLSADTPMRTASQVEFVVPVILDYRFQWNYQPVGHVVGHTDPDIPITSENDRPPTAPEVGGNLTIGAFNVLNYFDDLGVDEAGCGYFTDREGNPVAADGCEVRGAYSPEAFADQEAKLVAAINKSGADILGLMEIENSAGISYLPGQPRDKALATLVAALNEAAGTTRWALVPSPVVTPTNEDVIRTAFIYDPNTVQALGASQILLDDAFADARYPLAQKFKAVKTGKPFVMIANHFKSKGSGEDDGTGQGNANPSRMAQAAALTAWAEEMYEDEAVFLVGDFNAYSKETPVQIIEAAGYTNLAKEADARSATYQFSGRLGSLDHVFANSAAERLVTGAAVWDINGDESIAFQYSRRNYNLVDYHVADEYASSDHDPVLVGLDTGPRGKKR